MDLEATVRELARVAGVQIAAEGVEEEVTLELDDMPLRQVLGAICMAAGCTWSYDEDRGGALGQAEELTSRPGRVPRGTRLRLT